jgi:hypothetical protein
MCCPRGATKEELIFKTDGAVAMTDMEFENWNSSRSSFSLSPTLQYNKMGIKTVCWDQKSGNKARSGDK